MRLRQRSIDKLQATLFEKMIDGEDNRHTISQASNAEADTTTMLKMSADACRDGSGPFRE